MVCVQCQLGGFELGEEKAKTDLPTEFFVYKEWHTPRTLVGTGVEMGTSLRVHLPLSQKALPALTLLLRRVTMAGQRWLHLRSHLAATESDDGRTAMGITFRYFVSSVSERLSGRHSNAKFCS